MPSFLNLPIPDLLRGARDLYTNARDDAEVFALLSAKPWSFTAADFDAGLALIAAAAAALQTEARETRESEEATTEYDAAVDAVRSVYGAHRDRLRDRFSRRDPEYDSLGLSGEAPADREALLKEAADFYARIATETDLLEATRGISAELVTEAEALIEAARTEGSEQTKESGDAEVARRAQQAAVRMLRKHAALTGKDAAAALADHPQLRERLGLLERS